MSNRRAGTRLKSAVIAALFLAVVGGVGVWLYPGSSETGAVCERFLGDHRVRTALGEEYRSGLSCAQLGAALKDVTTGPVGGEREHSLQQAWSMQSLLAAMDDVAGGEGRGFGSELSGPLSDILADYARDVEQILTSVNIEYIRRDASSTSPWQDQDGVHVSVSPESMLHVLRALSANPVAYANVRDSLTREIAGRMSGTPRTAEKDKLALLAKLSAGVLGDLDAVAEKARVGQGDGDGWDRAVLSRLTEHTVAVPPYSKDPAGHLVESWKRALRTGAGSSSGGTLAVLETQGVEMTRTWSAGLGVGRVQADSLVNEARDYASSSRGNALRQLK